MVNFSAQFSFQMGDKYESCMKILQYLNSCLHNRSVRQRSMFCDHLERWWTKNIRQSFRQLQLSVSCNISHQILLRNVDFKLLVLNIISQYLYYNMYLYVFICIYHPQSKEKINQYWPEVRIIICLKSLYFSLLMSYSIYYTHDRPMHLVSRKISVMC